jgi:hypothetical protein
MARLALTLACGDYDRTRALADGRVTVEGADLTVLALGPEEIFFRMVRFEEFDVAELSLSTYLLTAHRGAPFVAIPVFPPGPSGTAGSTSTRGPASARRRTWWGGGSGSRNTS